MTKESSDNNENAFTVRLFESIFLTCNIYICLEITNNSNYDYDYLIFQTDELINHYPHL